MKLRRGNIRRTPRLNHSILLTLLIIKNKKMSKEILQVENTNSEDFKNEIVKDVITGLKTIWGHNQNNNSEIILSRDEAAKLLSISLVTLWDLTRKDKIPAFRIGNKVRYKKSDVLNALTQKNQF